MVTGDHAARGASGEDREWMDAALGPVQRGAEPSAEALAFTKAHGMGWCAGEGIPHDGPFSSKRCGPCYTAMMLDEFAASRVRAAIETACAAVCHKCRQGDAPTGRSDWSGLWHCVNNNKVWMECKAGPIRTAFAGAAKKEGA